MPKKSHALGIKKQSMSCLRRTMHWSVKSRVCQVCEAADLDNGTAGYWERRFMVRNVYTVKQVNAYIKNMFTQDYMLNRIYVKGEEIGRAHV